MSTALLVAPSSATELTSLESGIAAPVVYASLFGAPVPRADLWTQVVGVEATEDDVRRALARRALDGLLFEEDGLVWLRSVRTGPSLAEYRRRVLKTSDLLNRHRLVLDFIRRSPGVRFAGLSGGCAHGTADDGDIDVFVVTEPGALWRTLTWSTVVAKVRGWRRVLCLNYLIDATALELPWRDFYGGFEMISLKPVKGERAFEELLAANHWAAPMFPNFFRSRVSGQNSVNRTPTAPRAQLLEATARMILRPYLRHRLPRGTGVELSDHVVRLHATDHRARIRGRFRDALQSLGMEAPPWI